jgi:hypothetical protein
MFRERIVAARIDQAVSEFGMVYPVNEYRKTAQSMIAVRLPGAFRIEIQTRVHVDDAGLKGTHGDATRMPQHLLPVFDRGGRNRARRDLETAQSTAVISR